MTVECALVSDGTATILTKRHSGPTADAGRSHSEEWDQFLSRFVLAAHEDIAPDIRAPSELPPDSRTVNTPLMIKAVLFDMDGVLVDSEPAHYAVTRETLGRFDLPIPDDDDWEAIFFGRPDRDGLTDWFLAHHVSVDIDAIMADLLRQFEDQFTERVAPFEDALWLARSLHAAGIALAIVSGARHAEIDLVISRFGLSEVFRATVSSDDILTGKPDPEGFLNGASALGVEPEDCIVIEDALPGVRAAQAAGMALVVVDRMNRPERFAPLVPVARLDEAVLAVLLAGRGVS